MKEKIEINSRCAMTKWIPLIDSYLCDIDYFVPFILEDIAVELEKRNIEESYLDYDKIKGKKPILMDRIKDYLISIMEDYYIEDVEMGVNPFSGKKVFKKNGKFLNIEELRSQRIKEFLKDINFSDVVTRLYNEETDVFIKKYRIK